MKPGTTLDLSLAGMAAFDREQTYGDFRRGVVCLAVTGDPELMTPRLGLLQHAPFTTNGHAQGA
jgi:hypothetical protein